MNTARRNAIRSRAVAAALAATLASASGCGTAPAVQYDFGPHAVTPDGLHRIKWTEFPLVFVKPGADLQRYDKVRVETVTINYKRPPKVGGSQDPTLANFKLSQQALDSMKRYFRQAFDKELAKGKVFRLVQEPGPDVLTIAGHIVDLQVTAPPIQDQQVDERVYTSDAGNMALVLDVEDSVSGEALVRIGDRRAIQLGAANQFYQSDPVSNSAAVRELFDHWAGELRRQLEELHKLPEVPALPADHS